MNLSEFKRALSQCQSLNFVLPNGQMVPSHFHVTEVGQIDKHFIDCGGTVRHEQAVNFQLWEANDYDHRLGAEKLAGIIALSEKQLGIGDHEIEIEYQGSTIGKYHVSFENGQFHLLSTATDCLAKDNCGIPTEKLRVSLSGLGMKEEASSCAPGSGCC